MTRKLCGLRTTELLPHAPYSNAGGQQCRLGVLGLIELIFRAILAQCPQINPNALSRLVKRRTHHGVGGSQLGQHANRLGALAGENKRQ